MKQRDREQWRALWAWPLVFVVFFTIYSALPGCVTFETTTPPAPVFNIENAVIQVHGTVADPEPQKFTH